MKRPDGKNKQGVRDLNGKPPAPVTPAPAPCSGPVTEQQATNSMRELARRMYGSWAKNPRPPQLTPGGHHFVGQHVAWDYLAQPERDAWCAAAVEAFMFVAEGAAGAP